MGRRIALLAALVLIAACSAAGSRPASGGVETPSPTTGPSEPATAPPDPPTAVPDPSSQEPGRGSEEPRPVPPGAVLITGPGPDEALAGTIGSWTLDGVASDAPWLPAAAVGAAAVGAGKTASIGFNDGTPIGRWTASLAAVEDTTGEARQGGGSGDAAGATAITLPVLPAGSWVLAVTLRRADDRGDATYYWAVEVR